MPSIAESATSSPSGPPPAGAGVTIVNVAGRTVNVVGRKSAPVIQAKTIRDLAPTAPTQPTVVQALASTASTRAADASPSSEAVTSRTADRRGRPYPGGDPDDRWQAPHPERRMAKIPPRNQCNGGRAVDGARRDPSARSPPRRAQRQRGGVGWHLTAQLRLQPLTCPWSSSTNGPRRRPNRRCAHAFPWWRRSWRARAHRHPTSQPVDRPEPHGGAVAPAHCSPTPVLRIGPQDRVAERPAIDIDRLADTVHARLLRRLAIERERRGVMR